MTILKKEDNNLKVEKKKKRAFWQYLLPFTIQKIKSGESYTIEEKNYMTGEVKLRKTYTKDKFTGKMSSKTLEYPNDPVRGKTIRKFRNSHLRDVAVSFLLLFMVSMTIFSFIEDTASKWNSFFMNLAFMSLGLFFLLLFVGMIQMNIYERKLREEMPKVKREKIKLAPGAGLPVLLMTIAIVVTVVGVVIMMMSYDY